jgi:hypothetical protein
MDKKLLNVILGAILVVGLILAVNYLEQYIISYKQKKAYEEMEKNYPLPIEMTPEEEIPPESLEGQTEESTTSSNLEATTSFETSTTSNQEATTHIPVTIVPTSTKQK